MVTQVFARVSRAATRWLGHPAAFGVALLIVAGWALSKPLFDDEDSWQMVINTSTTILTFLIVFLIQGSQNRDAEAIQLKLDELIRALEGARNSMVAIEQLDEAELERLQKSFGELAARARSRERMGGADTASSATADEHAAGG